MSYSQARDAILTALSLPDTPVIALHGQWGTGKTHLWYDIIPEAQRLNFTPHYISCIPHNSIDSLRTAVLLTLFTGNQHTTKLVNAGIHALIVGLKKKFLGDIPVAISLEDIQMVFPALRDKLPAKPLVVLDDIERVAGNLGINNLLGLVSLLSTMSNAKIILIANKEKLADSQRQWDELREKIISHTIALTTSVDESISIALGGIPADHAKCFRRCIEILNVTNIRTMQHMRRVYVAIQNTGLVPPERWLSLIPSIALFVGIDQKVLDVPITTQHALEASALRFRDPKDLKDDERQARELLDKYELGAPDEFEKDVLVPFISSGYLNNQALEGYMLLRDRRGRASEVEAKIIDMRVQSFWGVDEIQEYLRRSIEHLLHDLDVIGADAASSVAFVATENGLESLGRDFVGKWVATHRQSIGEHVRDMAGIDFDYVVGRAHHLIQEAYRAARNEAFPPPSSLGDAFGLLRSNVEDRCGYVDKLNQATTVDYEVLIRSCAPEQRAMIFNVYERFMRSQGEGGQLYVASRRFQEACRNIVVADRDSRLVRIIKRQFEQMGRTDQLNTVFSTDTTQSA